MQCFIIDMRTISWNRTSLPEPATREYVPAYESFIKTTKINQRSSETFRVWRSTLRLLHRYHTELGNANSSCGITMWEIYEMKTAENAPLNQVHDINLFLDFAIAPTARFSFPVHHARVSTLLHTSEPLKWFCCKMVTTKPCPLHSAMLWKQQALLALFIHKLFIAWSRARRFNARFGSISSFREGSYKPIRKRNLPPSEALHLIY